MRTSLLAVAACLFAGCQSTGVAHSHTTMMLSPDDVQMAAEVMKYVPPGTPGDKAKNIMEAQGFDCAYERLDMGEGCLHCKITTAKSSLWNTMWHGDVWANVIAVDLGIVRGTVAEVKTSHQFNEPPPPPEDQPVHGGGSAADSDAVVDLEHQPLSKVAPKAP